MKKSAKIYAVLIALALLFAAGCGRKTADSDNVERSNELPSFISETTTTANDEVSTEKETGTTGENEPEEQTTDTVVIPETTAHTTPQTTPARENVTTRATEPEPTPATQTETKGQEDVPATKPAAHDMSAYPAYSSSNNYSELTKSYSNVTEDDINTINSILNSRVRSTGSRVTLPERTAGIVWQQQKNYFRRFYRVWRKWNISSQKTFRILICIWIRC